MHIQESHPLGELPINRIVKAMKTEQRDEYHCFIVLMRYETSILLGCHSQQVRIIYIPVGLKVRGQ